MIAITGATGAIPQAAARALDKLGTKFRVLARDPAKVRAGTEAALGDLDKPETLASALAGVESLFLVSPASPNMVAQQRNALKAAKAAGVKKIVRVSAWGAAAGSPAALGRWHGELDEAFRSSGMAYVALEPHGFMQNTLGYAGGVKGAGTIYAPLGTGRVCYIDARDVGAVAAAALVTSKWDGETLELTGPVAFSYDELAATLGAVVGKAVKYVDVPAEAAKASMLADGWPPWLVDDLLVLSKLYAANHASTPSGVVARVLGRPATSLETFLTEHRGAFGA